MALAGTLEIQMLANLARLQKDMTQAKGVVTGSMKSIEGAVKQAQQALGALGMGLSIGVVVAYGKSIIDLADNMQDLSQRVGIGIKDLATWQLAANQSGTSIESVAKGVKGLSVYMTENSEKLRKAGITATDANGAMTQLADLFKAMPDGVQKTALAVQLFGKAGMEMIPMLNMGSAGLQAAQEKAKAYGDKLAEIAPKADEFNDMMSELGLQSKITGMNIADHFLPGLIGMAAWLNDIAKGGKAAQDAVAWMLSDRAMKAMVLAGHPMLTGSGSRSASGKIGGKVPGMTLAEEEALGERNSASLRAQGLLDKDHGKDPYEAIRKHAEDYIKTLEKETAQAGLNVIQKRMIEASLEAVKLKTDKERLAVMEAAHAWAEATRIADDAAAAKKFLAEAIDAANKAIAEHAQKLGDEVAGAERELEIYGLTKSEIERLTIARLEENLAREQARDADAATLAYYEKEIEARKRIHAAMGGVEARDIAKKDAEDRLKQQVDLWKSIDDTAKQTFVSIFDSGKSAFDRLRDTLKNGLYALLYEMSVKKWLINIAASVGGAGVAQSAFGSSGGGINLPMGGGGGIYDAFATSGIGQSMGLSVPYIDALGGTVGLAEGGVMSGLGSGIGAALPWLGGGLAVASMLGMFGGDGPAQRTGRYVSPFAGSNAAGDPTQGNMPDGSRYNYLNNQWFSADMAPAQDKFDAELMVAEDAIISKLGLSTAQIAAINAQLGTISDKSYNFGTEHTDPTSSGAFEAIKTDRMTAIAQALGMSLKDLQDQMSGAAKTAKELADEAKKLADAAKQAAASDALAAIGATLKAIDAVTNLRSGILASAAGIRGGNTYASRMGGLQDLLAGETDVSRQVDLAGQIKDLILERYQKERDAITQNQAAAQQAAEALRAGMRSIGDYAKSLLLGNLSPLTNQQRMDEAGSQYLNTLSRAKAGDVSAVGALSGAAGTYLEQARSYYASSSDYSSIFGGIQSTLSAMGLSADSVMDATDWQAQMLAVDNEALGSLGNLTSFTESWTLNLETLLIDQTKQFEGIGLKLGDVSANTKDLDKRIVVLLDAALGARFDKLSAAVDKSAQTTARAMTNVVEVAVRN